MVHVHHAFDCPEEHWDCPGCNQPNCVPQDGDICGVCGEPRPGSDAEYYSRDGDFQRGGGPVPHTLPWKGRDK